MKTQISFKKTNGSDGVALLDGDASSHPPGQERTGQQA